MNGQLKHPAVSLGMPSFYNEHEPADSRRLIAVANAPLDEPPLGHIITFRHGGAERPVITKGGLHKRFRMLSTKTGLSEVGEGKGEQLLAMTCDVDPQVSNFKCHPYKFKLALGGAPFSYRPDIAIQYRNGLFEIVEVKRTPDDLDDELKNRLARVKEFVRRCGWQFSIRYLDEIKGSSARVSNVERLFGRRALKLTDRERYLADGMMLDGQAIIWGDLAQRLSPGNARHGDAVIEHLITAGYFDVDLDSRFAMSTWLTPLRHIKQLPIPGFQEDNLPWL
jgi:hypothetical protein